MKDTHSILSMLGLTGPPELEGADEDKNLFWKEHELIANSSLVDVFLNVHLNHA